MGSVRVIPSSIHNLEPRQSKSPFFYGRFRQEPPLMSRIDTRHSNRQERGFSFDFMKHCSLLTTLVVCVLLIRQSLQAGILVAESGLIVTRLDQGFERRWQSEKPLRCWRKAVRTSAGSVVRRSGCRECRGKRLKKSLQVRGTGNLTSAMLLLRSHQSVVSGVAAMKCKILQSKHYFPDKK